MISLILYVLIGFTIASILARLFPHEIITKPHEQSPPTVLIFLFLMVVWPLVALYWACKGPYLALDRYVNYLGSLKK